MWTDVCNYVNVQMERQCIPRKAWHIDMEAELYSHVSMSRREDQGKTNVRWAYARFRTLSWCITTRDDAPERLCKIVTQHSYLAQGYATINLSCSTKSETRLPNERILADSYPVADLGLKFRICHVGIRYNLKKIRCTIKNFTSNSVYK